MIKDSTLKRFVIIFSILIIIFGYAMYRLDTFGWLEAILAALAFSYQINRLLSFPKKEDIKPRPRKQPKYKQYDENRYPDRDMERIYEAYNIPKEDENIEEEEDYSEENERYENNESELMEEETPTTEIYSYSTIEDENQTTSWYLTPTGFPITLSILWFFIAVVAMLFDQVKGFITPYIPISFFIFIPILFLIGLSGIFGVLFIGKDRKELSSEENAGYVLNIIKIVAAWGIGIYIVIRHYFL